MGKFIHICKQDGKTVRQVNKQGGAYCGHRLLWIDRDDVAQGGTYEGGTITEKVAAQDAVFDEKGRRTKKRVKQVMEISGGEYTPPGPGPVEMWAWAQESVADLSAWPAARWQRLAFMGRKGLMTAADWTALENAHEAAR